MSKKKIRTIPLHHPQLAFIHPTHLLNIPITHHLPRLPPHLLLINLNTIK